jgi:hypothetical protein
MLAQTLFVDGFHAWTVVPGDCLAIFRWTDDTTPRTDKPVRFFPRRSFVEVSWKSHVWTPRDAESAKRHAEMIA